MDVELRQTDDILLVGIEAPFRHIFSDASDATDVVPSLWDRFLPRQDEVPHRLGRDVYAYMYARDDRQHDDELQYLVGVPASDSQALPDGMLARTLPGGLFAVCSHAGPPRDLERTIRRIYDEWLPSSGYEHTQAADVEHFTERTSRRDEGMGVTYWVSVAPR